MEENKIISVFMGSRVEKDQGYDYPRYKGISWTGWFCGSEDKEWCLKNALSHSSNFDIDYNLLMKVSLKIQKSGYWIRTQTTGTQNNLIVRIGKIGNNKEIILVSGLETPALTMRKAFVDFISIQQ